MPKPERASDAEIEALLRNAESAAQRAVNGQWCRIPAQRDDADVALADCIDAIRSLQAERAQHASELAAERRISADAWRRLNGAHDAEQAAQVEMLHAEADAKAHGGLPEVLRDFCNGTGYGLFGVRDAILAQQRTIEALRAELAEFRRGPPTGQIDYAATFAALRSERDALLDKLSRCTWHDAIEELETANESLRAERDRLAVELFQLKYKHAERRALAERAYREGFRDGENGDYHHDAYVASRVEAILAERADG